MFKMTNNLKFERFSTTDIIDQEQNCPKRIVWKYFIMRRLSKHC